MGAVVRKHIIEEWVKTKATPSISPVWPSTYNSSAKYWPVHEVSDSEMFAACTTSAVTWEWPNLGDSMPSPSSDIPLHPTCRSPAFPNQESWQWNSSCEPPPPPCSTSMAVSSRTMQPNVAIHINCTRGLGPRDLRCVYDKHSVMGDGSSDPP